MDTNTLRAQIDRLRSFLTGTSGAEQNPNAFNSANIGPIGPGDPEHFDSAPISKKSSGKILVLANASGTQAAQNVVSMSVLRDGTTPFGAVSVAPGGIGSFNWDCAFSWIDTLVDGLPHFYRLVCTTNGAGNLTIIEATFQVIEL